MNIYPRCFITADQPGKKSGTTGTKERNEIMDTPQRKNFRDIDEYIETFPPGTRTILEKMRETIHEAAPAATEAISYGIPAFRLNGILVYFAAFARHIGFYPTASGIAAFEAELTPYVHGKGSIQFPLDRPIPYDLVRRIVEFRVGEVTGGDISAGSGPSGETKVGTRSHRK